MATGFRAIASWALCLGFAATLSAQEVDVSYFEKYVRPILAEHCYECHSAQSTKIQAGLRVDHRQLLLQGGDSGAAIVPGDSTSSSLIQAVRFEGFEMPPKGKLQAESIEILVKWVEAGAPWPEEAVPEVGKPVEVLIWLNVKPNIGCGIGTKLG